MKLSVKVRENSSTQGKRKVFFTSHPEDFDKCFDVISDDILRMQNCAIYHAADPTHAEDDADEDEMVLSEMNLFVFPVTFKLLCEPNHAMDKDFAFAKKHHIPVLPIMMEGGIDEFYARKFDKIEYLNRVENDATSIGYQTKLSKYLSAVLLSDEMTERIRAAFEAYIFLSYRKKDRKYANELMRLIHRNPLCRDIAIWYDEYLIPGEDFEDTIKEALEKSSLFTMVVTPNIMESGNYVLVNEYPEACQSGKTILPVEMVDTDEKQLRKLFEGIPESVKGTGDEAFYRQILELLSDKGKTEKKEDPEHNFLVGLAYLDGIDVEKDYGHAVELITASAEAGLMEAMDKLVDIYFNGIGVDIDYEGCLKWTEKCVSKMETLYGPDDKRTLEYKRATAYYLAYLLEYQKAMEVDQSIYEVCCRVYGEEHEETLLVMRDMAALTTNMGEYQKAVDMLIKVIEGLTKTLGKDHPDTLDALDRLAYCYHYLCDYQKSYDMYSEIYEIRKRVMGEYEITTFRAMVQMGYCMMCMGRNQEAREFLLKLYEDMQKYLAPNDKDLFDVMSVLGTAYKVLGEYEQALDFLQRSYEGMKQRFGPDHPDTMSVLEQMAEVYQAVGRTDEAHDIYQKTWECYKKYFGDKHMLTLTMRMNMTHTLAEKGDLRNAIEMTKEVYKDLVEQFGEEYLTSLEALYNLSIFYLRLEENEKGLETSLKAYEIKKRVSGEEDGLALVLLNNIAAAYYGVGKWEEAVDYGKRVYEGYQAMFGEEQLMTHWMHVNLGRYYCGLGEYDTAIEILEEEFRNIGDRLGAENREILIKKRYLLNAYGDKGDYEKAMEIGNALLGADCRVLGEEHPETVGVRRDLDAIHERMREKNL